MPKTIIDYSKTQIYKIINYDCPELVYVGSTTNFTKRKQQHKEGCFNQNSLKYNLKIYKTIRENGNWESWNMIKICNYPCNDKREAELEEDKHMMGLKANMNMKRASRTKEQYYVDHIYKLKEKMKQYQENKKDKIKENNLKKCMCECGSTFTHVNKTRHKKTIKHQKYLNTIEDNNGVI